MSLKRRYLACHRPSKTIVGCKSKRLARGQCLGRRPGSLSLSIRRRKNAGDSSDTDLFFVPGAGPSSYFIEEAALDDCNMWRYPAIGGLSGVPSTNPIALSTDRWWCPLAKTNGNERLGTSCLNRSTRDWRHEPAHSHAADDQRKNVSWETSAFITSLSSSWSSVSQSNLQDARLEGGQVSRERPLARAGCWHQLTSRGIEGQSFEVTNGQNCRAMIFILVFLFNYLLSIQFHYGILASSSCKLQSRYVQRRTSPHVRCIFTEGERRENFLP